MIPKFTNIMDMYDDYLKSPYTVGYTQANDLTQYLKDNIVYGFVRAYMLAQTDTQTTSTS